MTAPALDLAATEVLVLACHQDGRPLKGLTGQVDWRCGGRISELVQRGLIPPQGPLLLPAPPVIPARRLIMWATADARLEALAQCLKGLGVQRAGLCPADFGFDPAATRAALGPQTVLYSPAGEPIEPT